jgi:hypothetical protein
MLSVSVRALFTMSVTVIVCVPLFLRMKAFVKVYTPALAAVKV